MTAIDAEHLAHQREWSRRVFGPGPRTAGVTDHIAKELDEIREAVELAADQPAILGVAHGVA